MIGPWLDHMPTVGTMILVPTRNSLEIGRWISPKGNRDSTSGRQKEQHLPQTPQDPSEGKRPGGRLRVPPPQRQREAREGQSCRSPGVQAGKSSCLKSLALAWQRWLWKGWCSVCGYVPVARGLGRHGAAPSHSSAVEQNQEEGDCWSGS